MQAHLKNAWILAVLMGLVACATTKNPYFETAPSQYMKEDKSRFAQAMETQKKGQAPLAIDMWQKLAKEHPRSFEVHNNLGMAYYGNDQLSMAIEELQKARQLEPNDVRIRENLIRALKFQTTLLTENKEYERAVENWSVIADLSPDEKEKISYKIEELEDKIFERAKQTNTMEDYKAFLQNYPESPYAEMARKKIEELKNSTLVEATVPAPMASPAAVKPTPPHAAKEPEKVEKGRKIKITAKSLRVRATPSSKAKAIARVKGGAIVQILSEKGDWYKIKYAKGKAGWISKKFTKAMK